MKSTCRRKISILSFLFLFLFLFPAERSLADQRDLTKTLTAAREAGLSDAQINQILAYGYDVRISTDNALELLKILTDARSRGFDVHPLLVKIDEGLAKRVSFEVIKAVLRKKIRDYRFVLSLYKENNVDMGGEALFLSLQRVADSVDLGLTYEELQSLFSGIIDVPTEMYEIAAVNMAFLKQLNFNPKLSLNIMRAGLKHKSLGPDWNDFFKIAGVEKRKGLSEEEISRIAEQVLSEKKSFKVFISQLNMLKKQTK